MKPKNMMEILPKLTPEEIDWLRFWGNPFAGHFDRIDELLLRDRKSVKEVLGKWEWEIPSSPENFHLKTKILKMLEE